MMPWEDVERAYFSVQLFSASKSQLQECLLAATNPPASQNPAFRERAAAIVGTVRVLLQLAESHERQRWTRFWAMIAGIVGIVSLAFIAYDHRSELFRRSTTQSPIAPTKEVALAERVVFKSGGIEKGLTHVTIRNNNTFPVRNVSVQIHFLSKSSGGVQHRLKWTISDLILPATDYEIEAIEAANPQIFVSHGSGSADEWIPWAEILNADRAEYHPQLLNSAVIIEGKTKVEFSTTAPPDWQIVIGLTTRIPKGH